MQEFIATLRDSTSELLSIATPAAVFLFVAAFYILMFFSYYIRISRSPAGTTEWIDRIVTRTKLTIITARHPMEKKDVAPVLIIMAVFSFLALFRLGNMEAPQTFFQFTKENKTIVMEMRAPREIKSLMFYTGLWTGHYKLEFSEDGRIWLEQKQEKAPDSEKEPDPAMNQPHSHLFKWRYAVLNEDNPAIRFIRISAAGNTPIELGELALFDSSGELIPYTRISCPDAPELFDEQELVPRMPTYMNSMYFDEIYHGRTGYEFLRGIYPYETTHPPLGKGLIAASIYAFGMTPFGWRFMGAVFGVAMLLVLYIFLKNMFGKTSIAVCGTLLFGFDFMRFVQTRIATIDTYGVFFILLAYFFMYRYITTDVNAPFRKSLAPLALSGIAFGAGCASKWIVVYAGLGLAVIYIIRLVSLSRHYRREELPGFGFYLTKTLLFSLLFFCVVPAVIYCLSYIPYGLAKDMTISDGMLWNPEYYKIIWDNQVSMFSYHGKLVAEHPYSSSWWQWILNARPILYVSTPNSGLRSSFAAFGNPIVWWGGFLAMIAMVVRMVTDRDGKALFILIGYLSQLLPWVAISRVVFIYHYFPSTLFLVLALALVFDTIIERAQGLYRQAVYGYTAATGVVFAMFYPALTGIFMPYSYFSTFVKWVPGMWPF